MAHRAHRPAEAVGLGRAALARASEKESGPVHVVDFTSYVAVDVDVVAVDVVAGRINSATASPPTAAAILYVRITPPPKNSARSRQIEATQERCDCEHRLRHVRT